MTDQRSQKVQFEGAGSVLLTGVLHEAAADTRTTVLLTHCFTCSKDYRVIVQIARGLSERGFRVLRFDFSGSGESQGDFSETSLATNVGDLVAASEWLASRNLEARVLIGHSLGGVAAILAAHLITEVRAVAVVASPSSSTHLLELIPGLNSEEFSERGSLNVTIGGRQLRITKQFVEELRRHSLQESAARLSRPFLVLHGGRDTTVPITEGERLFAFAGQPKSFFCIPDADHLFSNSEQAELAGEAIATWLKSCNLDEGERA